MKKSGKRVIGLLLAAAMLLAALAGCSGSKLVLGGTPETVGTVAGRDVPTGEYLAYMYTAYISMYYNQGLYMYAQYGMDPWEQEFSYGEDDAAQTVLLDEYIRLNARDTIVTQEAMTQLLEKYGLTWDTKEVADLEESMESMTEESCLAMGISKENMLKAYKNLNLNRDTLLMGLYGKGGKKEIAETDLKKYFTDNYVAYKIISVSLTDSEGTELTDDKKKVETDRLNGYLEEYNKDKNFEALVDKEAKQTAAEGEEVEASTDEDNFRSGDANDIDEYLVKEIRKIEVGKAAVVEYKASGSTPTAALILRLDINEEKRDLYKNANESIIDALKGEELEKEIEEKVKTIVLDFSDSAMDKCDPRKFESDE